MPGAPEHNQALFARDDDLRFYLDQKELFRAEEYILAKYLQRGGHVLEIGCGGGRVTAHLQARGCEVVAIDYNQAIVAEANERRPELDIRHGDARSLAAADGSLDVVFFSFNGIDYVPDQEGREQCLREAKRVLRPGGLFVFSSHNLKSMAVNLVLDRPLSFYARNLRLVTRRESRIVEHEYGGFDTHYTSTAYYLPLLKAHGFAVLETVGDRSLRFPRVARLLRVASSENWLDTWIYYVATPGRETDA